MRLLVIAAGLAFVGADAPPEGSPLAVETDGLAPGRLGPEFSRDDLPQSVLKLDSRRVTIRGYLYPTDQKRVKRFVLIGETAGEPRHWNSAGRDQVHQLISIRLSAGREMETEPFAPAGRPMIVEGRFVIDVRKLDGAILQLFRIEDATVRPAKERDGYQSALHYGC